MPLRCLLLSFALIGRCYFAAAVTCYSQKFTSPDWPYCFAATSNVLVYAGHSTDGNYMRLGMLVSGHTAGWSAVAFAGNGGMKGAREIVVRQSNGAWIAEDRYSTSYSTPSLFSTQHVKIMFAGVENGNTLWGVVLPMNSCTGTQDNFPTNYPLDEDFNRWLLWAYGSSQTFAYHGVNRGGFPANLYTGPQTMPSLANAQEFTMPMPNVSIHLNGQDAANPYVCNMFDLNQVMPGRDISQKHHAVAFEAILEPDTEQYVHHMILFQCSHSTSGHYHNRVFSDCVTMPSGCDRILWAWAKGSRPMVMPAHVGIPIASGHQWLAMQVHYYNPNQVSDLLDSSGVKMSITPSLRSVSAGFMIFNGGTSSGMRDPLPAGQQHVTVDHYVPSTCTQFEVTGNEVKVISLFYHEHKVGTHVNVDVIRNGSYIGVLRRENQYDFNHQAFQEGPVKTILPGDEFKMTCAFNTQSKSSPVNFGEASDEEMCWLAALVYPDPQLGSINYQKQVSGPAKSCCHIGGSTQCFDSTPTAYNKTCQIKGDISSAAATSAINQCSSCVQLANSLVTHAPNNVSALTSTSVADYMSFIVALSIAYLWSHIS